MESKLRTLQLTLASMLDQLDIFCREQNLPYYLIGGSTLGAVRHQGFIPWDDDVDVAMSRDIFERFEALAEGKKVGTLYYEPVEKHSFPEAPIGFLYDVSDPALPLQECPCIDVFPLDGIPSSGVLQNIQKTFSYLYHISVYQQPSQNRGKRSQMITSAFIKLTPKFLFKFYRKISKKVIAHWSPNQCSQWANIFGMARYRKEIMPKEYFGVPTYVEFEGRSLPIPEQADLYLRHLYGNYWELPPVEQRQPHHMDLTWEGE